MTETTTGAAMNSEPCAGVRQRLTRYVDDRLSAGERAPVARHLQACAACEGERQALLRTDDLVRAALSDHPFTDAATERLLTNLETIDWSDSTRSMQTNWIGRSIGADLIFRTDDGTEIRVFTTRPDTIFGSTYQVLASAHPH